LQAVLFTYGRKTKARRRDINAEKQFGANALCGV